MRQNVFVVALEPFNHRLLRTLPGPVDLAFHPLLSVEEAVHAERFDVEALLEKARRELDAFCGSVDAIIGYYDFPTMGLVPILRKERGLPGPNLESVLRCEHKYWCRQLLSSVLPEHVPACHVFDPFGPDPLADIALPFPFWIKPVKSYASLLGFRIGCPEDFSRALGEIQAKIGRLGRAFDQILAHAMLPEPIARVTGFHCVAEPIIATAWQATVEGYVRRGQAQTYGVVDSLRESPTHSSFSRYQYPSRLPERVQRWMSDLACRAAEHLALDESPFNVEFFFDEVRDHLWLLEINARISKSHSPLFLFVDGASNQHVMVELALGREPHMPHREGRYPLAAKFMVRVQEDGIVRRVPSPDDLARVAETVPGAMVDEILRPGMRLSALLNRDSYSYEIATLFLGGRDETELVGKYHRALELMPFEIEAAR